MNASGIQWYKRLKQIFISEPKDPTADSFTEKLIAQIIKNLQISVKGIHVRYEDRHSNRHRPFAAGITLESLEFQVAAYMSKCTLTL